MCEAQALEDPLTTQRHGERGLAAVLRARSAFNQAPLHRPLGELDGAVVLDLEALGHLANGRPLAWRQRLEHEQELVLLRLDVGRARLRLAEVQEATDLITELGEGSVLGDANVYRWGHRYIASRYI